MNASDPSRIENPKREISWTLLSSLGFAILLPLHLLGYNVIYTEGEVMDGLFSLLTFALAGAAALISVHSRRNAAFLLIVAGGLLLIWQSYQLRKWAMIHEEVTGIIRHVGKIKNTTGNYPDTIEGYSFKHTGLKRHISGYTTEPSNFHLSYFMNNPGTEYWYDSKNGFGYYPD